MHARWVHAFSGVAFLFNMRGREEEEDVVQYIHLTHC
jgi:hypothetical protein